MSIRRTAVVASFLFLVSLACFAQKDQSKPTQEIKSVEPLSSGEQLDLRAAEVSFYQAQNNMQQSPQYQQFQAAQTALQDLVNGIYAKRKTNSNEVSLCDGPSGGPVCAKVPKGHLELIPIPKEVKK